MGDSQIAGSMFRMRSAHQCAGAQGGNIGPPTLGCSITGYHVLIATIQYQCCSLHQQTGWEPFPPPVVAGTCSRSDSVATDSGHNSASQTYSGYLNMITDQLSQPNQPITTEWILHPEVVNLIFRLWGTPVVDMFATVHNTHLPQFMSQFQSLEHWRYMPCHRTGRGG